MRTSRATWLARSHVAVSVVALLLYAATPAAHSKSTVRVDDSGTVVSQPVVAMRWRKPVPSRAHDHTMDAELRVALRLNMQPFMNQTVSLYMGLAPVTGDPVSASWRTQGRLLPGTVRSGARTLVYHGTVTAARLEETIDLALTADGRNLATQQTLQFFFEADLP